MPFARDHFKSWPLLGTLRRKVKRYRRYTSLLVILYRRYTSLLVILYRRYTSLLVILYRRYTSLLVILYRRYTSLLVILYRRYTSLLVILYRRYTSLLVILYRRYTSLLVILFRRYTSLLVILHRRYTSLLVILYRRYTSLLVILYRRYTSLFDVVRLCTFHTFRSSVYIKKSSGTSFVPCGTRYHRQSWGWYFILTSLDCTKSAITTMLYWTYYDCQLLIPENFVVKIIKCRRVNFNFLFNLICRALPNSRHSLHSLQHIHTHIPLFPHSSHSPIESRPSISDPKSTWQILMDGSTDKNSTAGRI